MLRTFETDTARALSTADSRSRAFVDELRNQIFQSKSQEDTERERAEQRTNQKLDEIKRAVEKYVNPLQSFSLVPPFCFFSLQERLDKKIDDAIHQFERKTGSLEDHYKRAITDLTRNNEVMKSIGIVRIVESFLFSSRLNKPFTNASMRNIKKPWLI